MKKAFLLMALAALPALAELPPPSAAKKVEIEKEKAREQRLLEQQKKALEQAQERVARAYRAGPVPPVQEEVGKSDVPKSAQQPIGKRAEPHTNGRKMPQAEAHSRGGSDP